MVLNSATWVFPFLWKKVGGRTRVAVTYFTGASSLNIPFANCVSAVCNEPACTRTRTCVGSSMSGTGTVVTSYSEGEQYLGATSERMVSGILAIVVDVSRVPGLFV
jgi:hypothetical protein